MAESKSELVGKGTPGARQCKAAGCVNWFMKRSGRHMYCGAPDCPYKRGTSPPVEFEPPTGAAAEVLLRLMEADGGARVGPESIGPRLTATIEAQRRNDRDAFVGALVDVAVALIAMADRTIATKQITPFPLGAPKMKGPVSTGARGGGLVGAVLASHARTVVLAERRAEAIWRLLSVRDGLAEAEASMAALAGSVDSRKAQEELLGRRAEYVTANAMLQGLEAAWNERLQTLREMELAGQINGGANGRSAG